MPSQESALALLPLCRLSGLWRPESPGVDWGLPCQWLEQVATGTAVSVPLAAGLPPIGLIKSDQGDSLFPEPGGSAVVLAGLLDYTTHTYGPARLPLLLNAVGHFSLWETLIPAVFDVSAEAFEAGWREWLAAEYGVAVQATVE